MYGEAPRLYTIYKFENSMYMLAKAGLMRGLVCLNHDGLLQKAGCPQEGVVEVYGSWFDPANPEVGSHRGKSILVLYP